MALQQEQKEDMQEQMQGHMQEQTHGCTRKHKIPMTQEELRIADEKTMRLLFGDDSDMLRLDAFLNGPKTPHTKQQN